MTNYIYNSRGSAVGFWRDRYVYAVGEEGGDEVGVQGDEVTIVRDSVIEPLEAQVERLAEGRKALRR